MPLVNHGLHADHLEQVSVYLDALWEAESSHELLLGHVRLISLLLGNHLQGFGKVFDLATLDQLLLFMVNGFPSQISLGSSFFKDLLSML